MERFITIGSREIKFKCTAGTTARYAMIFPEDNLFDLLEKASGKKADTTVFLKLAYVMARQADPELKENFLDWLDGFEMLELYEHLPEIVGLWGLNMQTSVQPKKKAKERPDR